MYSSGYGYGYGVPGAFGYSLTSSSLKSNPHALQDWQAPHFNLKKASNVSKEIGKYSRDKEIGEGKFSVMGFDMLKSLSKAYPKTKFPQGEEGETTKEDLYSGIDQISKYVEGEKHRYDAKKHGINPDEHWNREYENAVNTEKEWNELKAEIEDDIAGPRIKAAIAPTMRSDAPKRESHSGGRKKRTRKAKKHHNKSKKATKRRGGKKHKKSGKKSKTRK